MARNIKRIVTEISDINASGVMEMTEPEVITQNHIVEVPYKFKAYVYIGNKLEMQLGGGVKEKLHKYAGDRMQRKVRVLFVNNRAYSPMSWGIGNLSISYALSDESFRWNVNVGANGTFLPVITDYEKFYRFLGKESGIVTKTEVVSQLTSLFRETATKVLRNLFNDASSPVFDSGFMLDECEKLLNEEIEANRNESIGVKFCEATVADIHISEADVKKFKSMLTEELENRKTKKKGQQKLDI